MIIVELSFKQQAKIPAILLEMILFNDNFKEQAKKCCICFFLYIFFYYIQYRNVSRVVPHCFYQ
jgi:hypothetical protein